MKTTMIAGAVACLMALSSGTVSAQSLEDRIEELEKKVLRLEIVNETFIKEFDKKVLLFKCRTTDNSMAILTSKLIKTVGESLAERAIQKEVLALESSGKCELIATKALFK